MRQKVNYLSFPVLLYPRANTDMNMSDKFFGVVPQFTAKKGENEDYV